MAITTFQEKHALPLSSVSEGKKYWVMIERVCVTLLTFYIIFIHGNLVLFTMREFSELNFLCEW